ncbi:N-acetyltransferase SLI1 [Frankliniella fusca]|uniref:N-acetyltransferase SLI1 n=1 Tax=Frankliniella fusca TaxID=407009 RepID=A0AAE1LQ52_9NEOP|nr:N-acetyltransferase SLI1 [Frankliniella fusca]
MLETHLDMIDSSDLYESWQKAYGISAPSSSTSVAASSSQSVTASSETMRQTQAGKKSIENLRKSVASTPSMPVFTVDSPYISSSVREAIRLKKRASVKGREETVQRIVDHCRETVPGLDRAMFDTVAQQLVTSYPDTFQDTISIGDCNYASLAKQLRVKYDNDKRHKSATTAERSVPARKEAYGCLDWNPDLPLEETPESLESLCQELAAMHKFSEREWDWKIIKQKMEASYYLQRKDINESVEQCTSRKRKRQSLEDEDEDDPERQTVSNIKKRWPFLFSPKGMNIHFRCLTGINFREALSNFIQDDCSDIIEALACKGEDLAKIRRQMVKAETNGHTSVKFPTAIKMLACALKDDMSRLVQFVERTTSFDEVKDVANFPEKEGTPILIAAGDNLITIRPCY